MAASNESNLSKAQEMVETIEATLLKLYAKTADSTSFGDQSRTNANIERLENSLNYWRARVNSLSQAIAGKRRTLKIQFPEANL